MQETFIIPYVSEEPKREKPLTPSMEKAAILCLAEARRKKRRILRETAKEIDYIVKVRYPILGAPWKNKCILVDGLGLSSAAISHVQIPNVTEFTEDLVRSSVSFNQFQKTLEKHTQTFREFISSKEEIIEDVIGDRFVLESISSLINQAVTMKETLRDDATLIPPRVLVERAKKNAEKLIGEWQRLQVEISALQYALEILGKEREHHEEKISREIEQIWRNYEKRISGMKKLTEKRTDQIIREKDKEIKNSLKLQERKLSAVLREERKAQGKIERLRHTLEENLRKRERAKHKYLKREKTRLDSKIRFYKEGIGELSKKIRDFSRLKKSIRKDEEETLRAIEEKYLSMVAKEMEKIEILKESRNLEIAEKREYIKKLDENASVIEVQIKRLLELKNESVKRLEEATLPLEIDETALIGIPFYLVQYKTPQKTIIDVYPPVIGASYDGIIKKIQKAIFSFNLEARIQLLLNPRSTSLNEALFENFKKSLETDSALREKVCQIGRSKNLLELPNFKEEITKGIEELEAEGWIDAREKNNILSIYARK